MGFTSPSFRATRTTCQGLAAPAVVPGRIWHHHLPRTTSSSWTSSSPLRLPYLNPQLFSQVTSLPYSPCPETPTFCFSTGIHQSKQISSSCEGWQAHQGEFPRAPLHLQHTQIQEISNAKIISWAVMLRYLHYLRLTALMPDCSISFASCSDIPAITFHLPLSFNGMTIIPKHILLGKRYTNNTDWKTRKQ